MISCAKTQNYYFFKFSFNEKPFQLFNHKNRFSIFLKSDDKSQQMKCHIGHKKS